MTKVDPLGVRPHDPLTKWQREAAEQEEVLERTRRVEEAERRRREERQAQDTVEAVRTELTNEVAGLRDELKVSRECIIDVTCEAVEKLSNKIFDEVDQKIKDTEDKLYSLVEQRFGRLEDRIAGALGERRFKRFANESIGDDELPNWRKPDKSTTH
jgi:F0F1-type ATP synthase membrane subunit b/b'